MEALPGNTKHSQINLPARKSNNEVRNPASIKYVLALIILSCISTVLPAQYKWTYYRTDNTNANINPLPNNYIFTLFFDSNEHLWITTKGGYICDYFNENITCHPEWNGYIAIQENANGELYFFQNGGRILRYRNGSFEDYNIISGIREETIRDATIAPDNSFYITRSKGIEVYKDGKSELLQSNNWFSEIESNPIGNEIYVLHYNKSTVSKMEDKKLTAIPNVGSIINAFYCDRQGQLWVGTELLGVFRLENNSWIQYDMRSGLPEYGIKAITEDKNGLLLIATKRSGICYLLNDSFYSLPDHPLLKSENISSLSVLDSKNVYVGFVQNGILFWNGVKWSMWNNVAGLPSNCITGMCSDNAGGFFIGTNQGLSRFTGSSWNYSQPSYVLKIEKGYDNFSYFLFYNKLYSYQNEIFQPLYSKLDIYDVWPVSKDSLAFVTSYKAYLYDGTKTQTLFSGTFTNRLYQIISDKDQNFWIASSEGLVQVDKNMNVTVYDKNNSPIDGEISKLYVDKLNRLWVSGRNSLAYRDVNQWNIIQNNKLKFAVSDFAEDTSQIIWMAIPRHGVYGLKDTSLITITTQEGLPSNNPSCLMFDSLHRLWIGTTDKGIGILDFNPDKPAPTVEKPYWLLNHPPKELEIILNYDFPDKVTQIYIYQITGRLMEKIIPEGNSPIMIHFQSSGIYFCKFVTESGKVITEKSIVY